MSLFKLLSSVDVGEHIEGKNGLNYLSWAWAFAYFFEKCDGRKISYEVWKDEHHRPWVYDENIGYMVFTSITIDDETREMWLPVMDSANSAMKAAPYSYEQKNGSFKYAKWDKEKGGYYDRYGNEQKEFKTIHVAAATSTDINRAIMRCLTKNLAMFGLGLYVYAGEDTPDDTTKEKQPQSSIMNDVNYAMEKTQKRGEVVAEAEARAKVIAYVNRHNMSQASIDKLCSLYGVKKLTEMTLEMCNHYINALEKKGGNINE